MDGTHPTLTVELAYRAMLVFLERECSASKSSELAVKAPKPA